MLICQKPECFSHDSYEVIIRLDSDRTEKNKYPSNSTNGQ